MQRIQHFVTLYKGFSVLFITCLLIRIFFYIIVVCRKIYFTNFSMDGTDLQRASQSHVYHPVFRRIHFFNFDLWLLKLFFIFLFFSFIFYSLSLIGWTKYHIKFCILAWIIEYANDSKKTLVADLGLKSRLSDWSVKSAVSTFIPSQHPIFNGWSSKSNG